MITEKRRTANGFETRADGVVIATIVEGSPVTRQPRASHGEKVGTALAARIEGLLKLKSVKGCGCGKLAAQMDGWGIAGCEQHRTHIVDALVKNYDVLAASLQETAWIAGFAASMIPEAALRAGGDWLLNKAIEDVRSQPKPPARIPRPRQQRLRGSRPPRNSGSIRGAFVQGSGPVRFVRSSQFQFDILNLIAKIPPDVTAIAGVARSGLSAATMLSMYLHLPMITIRQTMNDVVQTGNGWRLGGSRHVNPRTEKILVVDDTVMTGNSLKAIRPLVDREFGNAVYAAIYVNPKATQKPDIWAVDLPWPHILEWNVFNSILSPSAAMDFDGILCHDCEPWMDDDGPNYLEFIRNAKPLYVPRRCPVPLIITARIERYRSETENWLRRHGINWHRLVMHPAATLAERRRDNIAAYKAMHYKEWAGTHRASPGPVLFFESEDHQARQIASRTGLISICPHSAGVYGPQNY